MRRLRCSTRSPPSGFRLGTLIDIYRRLCCWRRYLRRFPCCGLATEPERLSHRRTALRISRGGEPMIAPQSPTLQVFIPIEPVARADVPLQGLPPVAAIQANHVILMYGSPRRHGWDQNFLCLKCSHAARQASHRPGSKNQTVGEISTVIDGIRPRKLGSHWTLRWRERDSNSRSPI
jgi:hypothetical protein